MVNLLNNPEIAEKLLVIKSKWDSMTQFERDYYNIMSIGKQQMGSPERKTFSDQLKILRTDFTITGRKVIT